MPMDPELRYDKLKAPWRGHALVDLVNERYQNRYDFSGSMSFQTLEELNDTAIFYDTYASDEDKEIDKWTGFPKNQFTYGEMVTKEPNWPTWDEIESTYQEYLEDYNAYEGKRQRQYPALKEQLDLLFHAIDDGYLGEKAKESDFFRTIKEIKENNQ